MGDEGGWVGQPPYTTSTELLTEKELLLTIKASHSVRGQTWDCLDTITLFIPITFVSLSCWPPWYCLFFYKHMVSQLFPLLIHVWLWEPNRAVIRSCQVWLTTYNIETLIQPVMVPILRGHEMYVLLILHHAKEGPTRRGVAWYIKYNKQIHVPYVIEIIILHLHANRININNFFYQASIS